MNKFTLRPGWLVSLSSRVSGGVAYERTNLVVEDDFSKWETTKKIDDPEERKAAEEIRGKARYLISSKCSKTDFGLICSDANEPDLDEAEVQARALCLEFNKTARFSSVSIRVLRGRIEQNDAKAAKAVVEEIKLLVDEMNQGIVNADPEAIREAADKASKMSNILSAEKSQAVGEAVAAARKAANTINKRVLKNGEDATKVLADIQIGAIEKARMAFLDMSDDLDVEELPAVVRSVEIDEAEVQAAEARKEFDAVDVPEVSPEALKPAAVDDIDDEIVMPRPQAIDMSDADDAKAASY